MPTAQRDTNGRITMAILGRDVQLILTHVEEIDKKLDTYQEEAHRRETRISLVEQKTDQACKQLEKNTDDIEKIWRGSKVYDSIVGFLSVCVSSIIGYITNR